MFLKSLIHFQKAFMESTLMDIIKNRMVFVIHNETKESHFSVLTSQFSCLALQHGILFEQNININTEVLYKNMATETRTLGVQ